MTETVPVTLTQGSCLQELVRLADLRDRGIITDEEFAAMKAQLLGL
jgi:hypothetical protein